MVLPNSFLKFCIRPNFEVYKLAKIQLAVSILITLVKHGYLLVYELLEHRLFVQHLLQEYQPLTLSFLCYLTSHGTIKHAHVLNELLWNFNHLFKKKIYIIVF